MTTFSFTAYENADLFGHGYVREHAQFILPSGPTLEVILTDDDHFLSGDARRNELGGRQTRADRCAETGR